MRDHLLTLAAEHKGSHNHQNRLHKIGPNDSCQASRYREQASDGQQNQDGNVDSGLRGLISGLCDENGAGKQVG